MENVTSSKDSGERYFDEFDEIEDVDGSDNALEDTDLSIDPDFLNSLSQQSVAKEVTVQDLRQASDEAAPEMPPFMPEEISESGALRDFSVLFFEDKSLAEAFPGGELFSGFDDSVFDQDELDIEITAVPVSDVNRQDPHAENEPEEKFYDEAALEKMVFGDDAAGDTGQDEEAERPREQEWESNIFHEPEPEEGTAKSQEDHLRNASVSEAGKAASGEARTTPLSAKGKTAEPARHVFLNQKRIMQIAKKIAAEAAIWVLLGLSMILVVSLISIYVIRFSVVSGHSMDPTLYDGETIMLSKLPYIFGDIEYGDIVVIDRQETRERTFFVEFSEVLQYSFIARIFVPDAGEDETVFWVKRVIGVEGDVISFEDGMLYRNGEAVEESYLYTQEISTYPNTVFTVGEGELFVMGDNRNNSLDSRYLTVPIKVDHVVGKVVGLDS